MCVSPNPSAKVSSSAEKRIIASVLSIVPISCSSKRKYTRPAHTLSCLCPQVAYNDRIGNQGTFVIRVEELNLSSSNSQFSSSTPHRPNSSVFPSPSPNPNTSAAAPDWYWYSRNSNYEPPVPAYPAFCDSPWVPFRKPVRLQT